MSPQQFKYGKQRRNPILCQLLPLSTDRTSPDIGSQKLTAVFKNLKWETSPKSFTHCLIGVRKLRKQRRRCGPSSIPGLGRGRMCEKFHQLLAVGRWFPPGTPVSSTRKLISSSFHRLDMPLAVAEALNPNKPNQDDAQPGNTT